MGWFKKLYSYSISLLLFFKVYTLLYIGVVWILHGVGLGVMENLGKVWCRRCPLYTYYLAMKIFISSTVESIAYAICTFYHPADQSYLPFETTRTTILIILNTSNVYSEILRYVSVLHYGAYLYRVDSLKRPFVERLATAVAIPSISADASYRPRVHEMGDWLKAELEKLGVTYILIQTS